jgi:hypothetical protein
MHGNHHACFCRHVLELPVRNSTCVDLITYDSDLGGFKVAISSSSSSGGGSPQQQQQQEEEAEPEVLYARKVVLATGIQVGRDIFAVLAVDRLRKIPEQHAQHMLHGRGPSQQARSHFYKLCQIQQATHCCKATHPSAQACLKAHVV